MLRRLLLIPAALAVLPPGLAFPAARNSAPPSLGASPLACEPAPELCNGVDDDCDVLVDEDFPVGEICSAGVGGCARIGINVCSADGQGVLCTAEPGPPATETCDEVDNDCDGTVDEGCGCVPPAEAPALLVSRPAPAGPSALLSWSAVPDATAYDVVRGGLSELRSSGGSFGSATQECLADERPETSLEHGPGPAPGAGFWYLVRAVGCGANGSYDDAGPGQTGSRDAEIAASPAACP
jgi:hypothetical protein